MSGMKRKPTTELNHDNWDDEDDVQVVEENRIASQEVLSKRVIKTARRRNPGNEPKLNAFSGFSGFSKPAPPTFDFLSKLTNGTMSSAPTLPTSSLFSSQNAQTKSNDKTENMSNNSPSATNKVFSFGDVAKNKLPTASVFSKITGNETKILSNTQSNADFSFGSSSKNHFDDKSIQPKEKDSSEKLLSYNPNEMEFYAKLQGLNECVSSWIQDHVTKSPLCILSPVFRDYEMHLTEIKKILLPSSLEKIFPSSVMQKIDGAKEDDTKIDSNKIEEKKTSLPSEVNKAAFAPGKVQFSFATSATTESSSPSPFSFGLKSSQPASTSSATFSFQPKPSSNIETNSSSFSSGPSLTSTPFSFGTGKPFSFATTATAKPSDEKPQDDDEEDKLEPQPEVKHEEEGSVYDIKCKVFIKKEGAFVDKGVGMLHIKPIQNGKKNQLLIRANTTVGQILLNLILSESIPVQRTGKNNITMVCIPTPDSKPPPVPILIRVKTSDEADTLLDTLNKYKT